MGRYQMDSPDWNTLREGVEELGHGAIKLYEINNKNELVESDHWIDHVVIEDDEIKIVIE